MRTCFGGHTSRLEETAETRVRQARRVRGPGAYRKPAERSRLHHGFSSRRPVSAVRVRERRSLDAPATAPPTHCSRCHARRGDPDPRTSREIRFPSWKKNPKRDCQEKTTKKYAEEKNSPPTSFFAPGSARDLGQPGARVRRGGDRHGSLHPRRCQPSRRVLHLRHRARPRDLRQT